MPRDAVSRTANVERMVGINGLSTLPVGYTSVRGCFFRCLDIYFFYIVVFCWILFCRLRIPYLNIHTRESTHVPDMNISSILDDVMHTHTCT